MATCSIVIGSLPPILHFLCEVAAFLIGFHLYRGDPNTDPLTPTQRYGVATGAVLGALVGAKTIVWLNDPVLFFQTWAQPWLLMAGKGIVGALAGAWLGVETAKRILKLNQRTGDHFVWPLLAAIAMGRVGCFLTGFYDKTYGVATALPWAVDFGDGVCRHPTQLYEILFLGGLALWIAYRKHVGFRRGELFQWFIGGYGLFRFFVDFIKPIPHPYCFADWCLCANQILGLVMALVAGVYLSEPLWGTVKLVQQETEPNQSQ